MRYCYLSLNTNGALARTCHAQSKFIGSFWQNGTAKIGPVHDNFSPVSLAQF